VVAPKAKAQNDFLAKLGNADHFERPRNNMSPPAKAKNPKNAP